MGPIDFLRLFNPDGPWVLTAISVDRKGVETQTFTEFERVATWVAENNGKRNLYFTVNRVARPLTKKAQKSDIAAALWLHVDVDARAREERAAELERIRKVLADFTPKPTFIVFSGGGYQAFWKLKEPVTDPPTKVEPYNKHMELVLGGDHCFNVDRIMRLPGTMNIPDAKKTERGRVATMAEVYRYDESAVYSLSDLAPARVANPSAATSSSVNIPDIVPRLSGVDALSEWNVPDRVKMIIVQGHDPDSPKEGDNSRSAWVFDVVCQLVRANVPDAIIYAVITDPNFAISASVLDNGSSSHRYALRQIQRAKNEVEEPLLRTLNDRFVIVGEYGGKCVVVEELERRGDADASHAVQAREQFCARFAHQHVAVGKHAVPLGKWWLAHPNARRFDRVGFWPGADAPEGAYNLWRGFAVEPEEGDCSLILSHVRENIAGEHAEWLLNWMARAVQHPADQAEIAVVLRGARGAGKSFFARQFGALFGPHYLAISNALHLVGNFNAHLEDCILLLADEAFYAGDRKHASVLKALVTEPTLTVERKGFDLRAVPNHLHIIMCSNDAWVVPAGLDERRFLVLDVSAKHRSDTPYFGAIAHQMENGGRAALLQYLLARNVTGWDFRRAPDTRALTDQKLLSMNKAQRAVFDALVTGAHPQSLVDGERVFAVTEDWRKELDVTAHALGHELRRLAGRPVRETVNGARCRGFWLPPLTEARGRWAASHGLDGVRWPEDVNEWEAAVEVDAF